MARLWQSGIEMGTASVDTPLLDFTNNSGSPTGSSSLVRSGTYAAQITGFSSGAEESFSYRFASSSSAGPIYVRFYIRFDTLPSAENRFYAFNGATGTNYIWLTIDNTGVIKLYDEDGQITGTTTLSLATWYRVEVGYDLTGAGATDVVEAKINGTTFASASNRDVSTNPAYIEIGANLAAEAQTTGNWYIDDVAINNSTGSFQNSWPGSGKIVHLRPNAAGDNSDWSNDYTYVDDVSPDSATTLVASNTLDQIDDHNIDPPVAIGTNDTINCVAVGAQFRLDSTVSTDPTFVLRIKAAASGTVEESATISPTSSTWILNTTTSGVRNYELVLYDLPGGSATAWTKSDLATAQIGYRETLTDTNNVNISAVWLSVDYTPATDSSTTLESSAGSLAVNTTTGGQDIVTGLGWTPKAVIVTINDLTADGSTTTARLGFGMATEDGSTMAMAVNHLDAAAIMNTDRYHSNRSTALLINDSGTVVWAARAYLTSDGFGIDITTTDGSARILNYYLIGGSDITNATIKQFTAATGTGTQAITGVGFQPDFVYMASAVYATAPPAGTTPAIMVYGWGTSSTERASMGFNMGNGGASSIEEKTQVTDKILHVTNGGATFMSADLDSLDSDGFTLDWSTVSTARYIWMLCLKGGEYKVGTITQPTSTGNQSVSSLGFTPKGIMTMSFNEVATGSLVEEINNTIGAATADDERWTVWVGSLDNSADAVTDQNLDRTQVTKSITPSTLAVEASSDFVSNDSDGFTLNFDAVDSTQREILYWAAGNPAGGASSVRDLIMAGIIPFARS